MPTKLRFFSQKAKTWQIIGNYSVNLQNTNIGSSLSTKLQDIIGLELKDDWKSNPSKYMMFTTIQAKAGSTNFLNELFINGTTESYTNASLAYGSSDNYRIDWDGTNEIRVYTVVMINDDGTMRFNVKYGTSWTGTFFIKKLQLFQLIE